MFLILYVSYLALTCLGLVFLKIGGQSTDMKISDFIFSMQMDCKFIIGIICYAISFLLYIVILQKRDLSYIYPLSAGIVNVVSVMIGVLVLKEKITLAGRFGIAAIIIGVVLLNIKG